MLGCSIGLLIGIAVRTGKVDPFGSDQWLVNAILELAQSIFTISIAIVSLGGDVNDVNPRLSLLIFLLYIAGWMGVGMIVISLLHGISAGIRYMMKILRRSSRSE